MTFACSGMFFDPRFLKVGRCDPERLVDFVMSEHAAKQLKEGLCIITVVAVLLLVVRGAQAT